jgi:hypothetical protein
MCQELIRSHKPHGMKIAKSERCSIPAKPIPS